MPDERGNSTIWAFVGGILLGGLLGFGATTALVLRAEYRWHEAHMGLKNAMTQRGEAERRLVIAQEAVGEAKAKP
ncbi:MAG: hypothetical protein K2W96_14840 [Gemmataceae bacterium]|nr:hypothetical protein [Gemmataceae bacterium]